MDALSSLLGRKLTEEIQARREEFLRPLINGMASDYPDYKARCGYLKALADFERMISEFVVEDDRRTYGAFSGDADRPRQGP